MVNWKAVLCAVRGHKLEPLPCNDKRWSIFYCGRCKQTLADLTPTGVEYMLAQDADSDLALQSALGQGLAQAMSESMDRIMRESFQEAADSKVNPLIARAVSGEELPKTPHKVEIPVRKMVVGDE